MARRDKIHNSVKTALIRDGWHITHDPLILSYAGDRDVFADLGAEKLFAAEKNERKIAVEIKSFLGASAIRDFQHALGQCEMYQAILEQIEPERRVYLAVGESVYQMLMLRPGIRLLIHLCRRLNVAGSLGFEVEKAWYVLRGT